MTQPNIRITAEDKTAAAFASVSRHFDQLGLNAGTLKGSISGALAALAVPVSAGAIASLVIESSKAIDEFNDLADATGASIENISALDRVARETGGTFDTAASALLKFNQILNDSGDEGKRSAEILKALGLNAKELKELDPAEGMRRLAVALSAFADNGKKGQAILALTGKSARELAPFLKDLAEKTELVGTVSKQAAEDAEKFNKELYRLKANADDVARSLSLGLIRVINQVFEDFRTFDKKSSLAGLASEVVSLQKQLDGLQARKGGPFNFAANVDQQIAEVSRKLAAAKERFNAEDVLRPRSSYDLLEDRRLSANRPSLDIRDGKDGGKKGGGAAKDPLAEAKRYLESLQRQLEKTQELSAEEQALAELRRISNATPDLERRILATARQIDLNKAEADSLKAMEKAAKDAADAAGRLHDEAQSLAQSVETPYEKLQRQLDELARTAENNPLISAETSARLGTKYWQDYLKSLEGVNKETDKFDDFAKNAAENIQGYLGESLQNAMEGNFENIGDAFVRMINRMVAEAIAADISRYLLGSKAAGGSGTGVLDTLISAGASFFFGGGGGFDMYGGASGAANSAIMSGVNAGGFGGVSGADTVTDALFRRLPQYDVGTDFVPYDQVAVVHKGERIVPAAENKPGWGGNTTHISVTVAPPAGTSRSSATHWGAEVSRQLQHSMSRVGR